MAEDHSVVPIKDYTDALFREVFRYVEVLDRKNERYTDAVDQKNQEALKAALASEQLARTVALIELNRGLTFHNDQIRKHERESASLRGEMVTKVEFRPVADFVERSRQSAITVGKFIAGMFAIAGLCLTLGFGLASYLQSARTASAAAHQSPGAEVVIPLPAPVERPAPR